MRHTPDSRGKEVADHVLAHFHLAANKTYISEKAVGTNKFRLNAPDRFFPVLIVVVLILTHLLNAVSSHRTGSNNSGAEDYLRRKTNKNGR